MLFLHRPQDHGAVVDGATLDTAAIQRAIDAAHRAGGGTVLFTAGAYLSGSLTLRDHVTLHLDAGATLLGSTRREDYSRLPEAPPDITGLHADDWKNLHEYDFPGLILARGARRIAIEGDGAIDGQGEAYVRAYDPVYPAEKGNLHPKYRPILLHFADCADVRISGITLKNSSSWTQCHLRGAGLHISNITVHGLVAWNNDGIDLVDTRDAVITGCRIDCADDAICLKSTDRVVENVTISNCILRCSASAFKCGTGSAQGFRNITVSNLVIFDTARSGVALEIVDGGIMELITITNLTMRNVGNAFFIRIGDRARLNQHHPNAGIIRQVRISNVTAEITGFDSDASYPFRAPRLSPLPNPLPASITGLPSAPVRDITLSGIHLTYIGAPQNPAALLSRENASSVPESPGMYPEYDQFGELPSWALYLRHVDGLHLNDVRLALRGTDPRPAILAEDAQNLHTSGLHLPAGDTGIHQIPGDRAIRA